MFFKKRRIDNIHKLFIDGHVTKLDDFKLKDVSERKCSVVVENGVVNGILEVKLVVAPLENMVATSDKFVESSQLHNFRMSGEKDSVLLDEFKVRNVIGWVLITDMITNISHLKLKIKANPISINC